MKIRVKYETTYVNYEISNEEIQNWLGLKMEENEKLKDFETRVNEEINKMYNRPDYNNWHKLERHLGNSKKVFFTDIEEIDGDFEPFINEAKNKHLFFKSESSINKKIDYEAIYQFINSVLKPEIAELFIAIKLNKEKIKDYTISKLDRNSYSTEKKYQEALLKERNNNSKKLKRATEKIKDNFFKTQNFGLYQGININKLFLKNKKIIGS